MIDSDTACFKGKNFRVIGQSGKPNSYAQHRCHGNRVEKHVWEQIGKEPDKICEADIELKNDVEKWDKLGKKKNAIHDDKAGKERCEHFCCQITVEKKGQAFSRFHRFIWR